MLFVSFALTNEIVHQPRDVRGGHVDLRADAPPLLGHLGDSND